MSARLHDNAAWSAARPALSVLIPFLRDDPRPLLEALASETAILDGRAELVLLDDGTGDAALTADLETRISGLALPARLVTLVVNEGRAVGRNRLASAARARHLLFLDSDMRPDRPDFLTAWLTMIDHQAPALAFGGFSLDQASTDAPFRVHRAIALRSECVPAGQRALQPAKYVYTSNLLVRRDVFEGEAFDPGFSGWGWEDVEWATRVAARHPVLHVDNPATHMGLDTVPALARKYEQSAPNFARMAARHPATVAAYPSFRAARALKRAPLRTLWRPWLRRAAEVGWLPVATRAFSLRLYRAALYADAV